MLANECCYIFLITIIGLWLEKVSMGGGVTYNITEHTNALSR